MGERIKCCQTQLGIISGDLRDTDITITMFNKSTHKLHIQNEISSTLWGRNLPSNFSTHCTLNVKNTGTKQGSIMK
jgi:hypothetical protein